MKSIVLSLLLASIISTIQADSQVVYFPAKDRRLLDIATQEYIKSTLLKKCSKAFEFADLNVLESRIVLDEIDQGVIDKYVEVVVDVRYDTNDDDSDEIALRIEDTENMYPNYPRFSLVNLRDRAKLCK
jgi:hypothetical protein